MSLISHPEPTDANKLPEPLINSGPLRARVQCLGDKMEGVFTIWQNRGLPPARTPEGDDVMLPWPQHLAIVSLLKEYEVTADVGPRRAIKARYDTILTDSERMVLRDFTSAHSTHISALLMTTGEVEALTVAMDRLLEERPPEQEPPLPDVPVDEPGGEIIYEQLPSAGDIDTMPPKGTMPEVLAWVGGDPVRARKALDAEQSGKNRKGIISKLVALLADGGGAVDTTAPSEPAPKDSVSDLLAELTTLQEQVGRAIARVQELHKEQAS